MKQSASQKGFGTIGVAAIILVVAVIAFAGWYVWNKNKKDDAKKPVDQTTQNQDTKKQDPPQADETAAWTVVATQGKKLTLRVPDGWNITSYPGDFLGSASIVHRPGTPATVEVSSQEYVGHSLQFRVSIEPLDDAGLGPQWASPQPGLEESKQDFAIDTLRGQRFKGVFTGDINRTLYEYVFDLGNGKKLDIVYTLNSKTGVNDDVATVEKAIKTIKINN